MNQYEYEAELERIKRQRAISDALLSDSMKPMGGTQMVGSGNVQLAVPMSPVEALSRALTPMAGAWGSRKLDDRAKELRTERGGELTQAIKDYQTAVQGGTKDSIAALDLLGRVADPQQAATLIATNALKPHKSSDVKFTKNGRPYTVDLENNSINWLPDDITPPPQNLVTGTVGVEGDPEGRQTAVIDPNTNSSRPVGAPYKAKPTVQLSTEDKIGRAYGTSVIGADVTSLKKEEEEMRNSAYNIATMEAAKAHIPKAITGIAPDARLNFARGISLIFPGAKIDESIINSQEFDAKIGDILLQNIRKLAPVTENDIVTLKAIIGSRANNPNALVDILTFTQNKLAGQVESYNQRNRSLRSSMKDVYPDYGYTGEIEIPAFDRASTLEKIDEELRRRRGGK